MSALYFTLLFVFSINPQNSTHFQTDCDLCEVVLFSDLRWGFCKSLSMFHEDVKLHKKVESRNERNTTKLGHQPHHVTGGQGHQESGQGHSDERRETARGSGRKWWGYAVVVRGWHCFIFHLNRPQQMYKCSLMWNSNVDWTFGQLHVVLCYEKQFIYHIFKKGLILVSSPLHNIPRGPWTTSFTWEIKHLSKIMIIYHEICLVVLKKILKFCQCIFPLCYYYWK